MGPPCHTSKQPAASGAELVSELATSVERFVLLFSDEARGTGILSGERRRDRVKQPGADDRLLDPDGSPCSAETRLMAASR